jgi:hypothetical protein
MHMSRTRQWLPYICLGVIYLLLVVISWKRWANPIVDCGREMYVPWQISEGKMLYRDLFWMYGPLVPYWHALLFKLFGVHLNVLYAVGLMLTATQTALIFVIARRVLSESLALLAGALFLCQFAFRPSLGNLVFPYSFNAAYACALNLTALWLVLRQREQRSETLLLFCAGICVGLSLLCKQEIGLAALAYLLVYLAVPQARPPSAPVSGQPRERLLTTACCLFPALVLPLLGYGWFASQLGLGTFLHDSLWPRETLAQMKFFEQYVVGTLFDPKAILYLLGLSLWGMGTLWVVLGGAYIAQRFLPRFSSVIWITAVALALIASPWSDSVFRFLELNHLYAANLILLLIALVSTVRARSALFWISLFALCNTWRAPVFAGISAYSSFFMPASVVVFVWFWAEWIPAAGKRMDGNRWRFCLVTALVTLCVLQLSRSLVVFRVQLSHRIESQRGMMIVHRDIGPALVEAMRFLAANTRQDEPILLFPEETSLYFLCDRHSPSRYYQFAPALMPAAKEERALIRDANAAGVRIATVSNRSTTEYGKPYFGLDYYPLIREWLLSNFHLVKTTGNPIRPIPPPPPSRYWPNEGYGIEIYERNK